MRLTLVLACCWLACAHQQPVTPAERTHVIKSAAVCQAMALQIAATAPTCPDVLAELANLLKSSPECQTIYEGGGFQVHCPGDKK